MKDRGDWCAAANGVSKSLTWISDWTRTKCPEPLNAILMKICKLKMKHNLRGKITAINFTFNRKKISVGDDINRLIYTVIQLL